MAYILNTVRGADASLTVPTATPVAGFTWIIDFFRNGKLLVSKTITGTGKTFNIELSSVEVDKIGDARYRIRAMKNGQTVYLQSGSVNAVSVAEPEPDEINFDIADIVASAEMRSNFVLRSEYVAGEGADPAAVQELIDYSLDTHIASHEPHPEYDDLPSLRLLFENGLI